MKFFDFCKNGNQDQIIFNADRPLVCYKLATSRIESLIFLTIQRGRFSTTGSVSDTPRSGSSRYDPQGRPPYTHGGERACTF